MTDATEHNQNGKGSLIVRGLVLVTLSVAVVLINQNVLATQSRHELYQSARACKSPETPTRGDLANTSLSMPDEPQHFLVKNIKFLAKSTPVIVPAGTVIRKNGYLHISGDECAQAFCDSEPEQENYSTVHIQGDVIVTQHSNHYFHFIFEAVLRLWTLRIHGTLERYPNSTILWFNERSHVRTAVEMMRVIWPDFPIEQSIFGQPNTLYKVDDLSTMIMTRHNDYHKKAPWGEYNFWLIDSMRKSFEIVENPTDELFISRRGIRRAIAREHELYTSLQSSILPNLRLILPDDFSVAEQAQMFSRAKLIIAPHGASLTNALFSNWDKLVLVEITKSNSGGAFGTFRNDLRVKQHYLLKCQSVPCSGNIEKECDPWNTEIDANIQNATETIRTILFRNNSLQTDFIISPGTE